MSFRFQRRIRLGRFFSLNLSKSGPSLSVGPRGLRATVGHGRLRTSVGLPGTGMWWTQSTRLDGGPQSSSGVNERDPADDASSTVPVRPATNAWRGVGWLLVGVALLACCAWLALTLWAAP
jgi:Protein of unknown function (DUF4236)